MSDKPFKMKGSPFQRNFGIGRTESPDAESPYNKIDLKKALAAGMATLPGGHDAYQSQEAEYERGPDGRLLKDKDGNYIKKKQNEHKVYTPGDLFGDIKNFLTGSKKETEEVEVEEENDDK